MALWGAGFCPLHPPGLNLSGTGYPCRCGTRRVACFRCRLPTLPLAWFSAPIPPTPLPSGKGETLRLFYARGFAPCIPGIRPPAALTEPAAVFPGEGLCPLRGGDGWRSGTRRGAWRFWSPACLLLELCFFPHPPAPLPSGKGETQSFLMQGASPLASLGLNPRGTYRTCQAGARSGALPLAGRGWVAFRYPAGGVAVLVARLPFTLALFLPPSPRPPSQREGGDYMFISPGASPPAPLQPGGTRHWHHYRHQVILP